MQVVSGFSKGIFSSKKRVVLHSECIDRRRKENSAYRASKVRHGKIRIIDGTKYIIFDDGEIVKY